MKHARKDYNGRVVDLAKKIPEDEPVFLLRAQDVAAPDTVEYWEILARRAGARKNITDAAKNQAEAMREWQREHGMKIPDMPQDK